MVMANPRSNLSAVCASTEVSTAPPSRLSKAGNSRTKGDRPSPQSSQSQVSQSLDLNDPLNDPWTRTFETLLVQTALDSLFDGVLIVNVQGEIMRVNHKAQRLLGCNIPATCLPVARTTLGQHQDHGDGENRREPSDPTPHPLQPLLDEIWRVCRAVIDSRTEFPHHHLVLDSDITIAEQCFRIRVHWMNHSVDDQPCLMVSIEDLWQTPVHAVNRDRWTYHHTTKEMAVWRLKSQGYSLRAIAQTLCVSEHTVKKHLKQIQVKRGARF